jgi:hypothetical protein
MYSLGSTRFTNEKTVIKSIRFGKIFLDIPGIVQYHRKRLGYRVGT